MLLEQESRANSPRNLRSLPLATVGFSSPVTKLCHSVKGTLPIPARATKIADR